MPCRICQYNQVRDIDRLLLAGVTPAALSQKYSFSLAELQRHQEHLQQKMALASSRFHATLQQGLFLKLNIVMEMVLGVVRGARAGEDFKLFLQASREFTRIIALMPKMAVPLDPELQYCLMSSAQWDLQDNLLPDAFQALASARQTMKVNLFAPCPESDLVPETNQTDSLGTQNPELESPGQTSGTRNQELETPSKGRESGAPSAIFQAIGAQTLPTQNVPVLENNFSS